MTSLNSDNPASRSSLCRCASAEAPGNQRVKSILAAVLGARAGKMKMSPGTHVPMRVGRQTTKKTLRDQEISGGWQCLRRGYLSREPDSYEEEWGLDR